MPIEEGLVNAAMALIAALRAQQWTWLDMEKAQKSAGFDRDKYCSFQMLRIFYIHQTSGRNEGVPSPTRLETFLKTFDARVIISLPEYEKIGSPSQFCSRFNNNKLNS